MTKTLKKILICFILSNTSYAFAAVSPSEPHVEIDVVNDKFTALRVNGTINTLMHEMLKTAFADLPNITHIILNLNSTGGSNFSGEDIIELIEEYKTKGFKFSTTVENGSQCLSMCIPIFMTGTTRYAGERSIFMFHGASPWFTNIPDPKSTQAYLDLLVNMGVSKLWLQNLIELNVFTEPTEYWATGEDLFVEQANIVTKLFPKIVKIAPWMAPPASDIRPR